MGEGGNISPLSHFPPLAAQQHAPCHSFPCAPALLRIPGLYTQGFIYGGPVAIIWGWVIVTTMTMTIGASLAEICSAFPTAGSVYYFSYALASPNRRALAAWVTGACITQSVLASLNSQLQVAVAVALCAAKAWPRAQPRDTTHLMQCTCT
jgi:amino acid transporter